jgi:hypothetical protein
VVFSVIIPFEHHRGQWRQCLAAWVAQTFPAAQFELVLALPAKFSSLYMDEIKAALRPHDRIVIESDAHEMGLSAVGARLATGRYLFFTESHCWPEPDALEICMRTFDQHPEWAGFSCRSMRIANGRLAQAEADMYEGDITHGMTAHRWLKILDQCFATRREAYQACGGLRPELGHFAEWVLAADYFVRQLAIGYQPDARFHHYYGGDVRELVGFTRDFVAGEITYLNAPSHDKARRMLEAPYEWSCQGRWDARAWLVLAHIALKYRPKGALLIRAITHRAVLAGRHALLALRAATDAHAVAPLAELWSYIKFRAALFSSDRPVRSAAFRAYIGSCIRAHRLQCIKRSPAARGNDTFDALAPSNTGFYPIEMHDGAPMRWTESYALLRGQLPAGRHEIEIDCAPLRDLTGAALAIFFNGARVADAAMSVAPSMIRIAVTQNRTGPCHLALICTNPAVGANGRPVALPVKKIHATEARSPEQSRPAHNPSA